MKQFCKTYTAPEFVTPPGDAITKDLNSVGVLLCKGKDTEVVEYAMARNSSPAMIADYETKLIPKNVLANKLHQLVAQLSKQEKG